MTIIDTSSWIDYFKGCGNQLSKIDSLLYENKAAVNSVILFELIPAMIKQKEDELLKLLRRLKVLDTEFDLERLSQYQLRNFKSGINNVGLSDIWILDSVLIHRVPILHHDRHFEVMKNIFRFETE